MKNTDLKKFDPLEANALAIKEEALKTAVSDNKSLKNAQIQGKSVVTIKKEIDARRKEILAPAREFTKQVNDYAKKILEPVIEAETHLRGVTGEYLSKVEAERLEQERKAEEARKQAEKEAAEAQGKMESLAHKIALNRAENDEAEIKKEKPKGVSYHWDFELVNFIDVPDEYKVLDKVAVRDAINRGERKILGLKIEKKMRTVFR